MRVLISAYACEPETGSEPGVGWNWALQAARHGHDVLVITRANNRDVIEKALQARPTDGLRFHYVDLSRPFLAWKKHLGYYGLLSYYYLWQVKVWFAARRLHRQSPFDLAHHVTFVNDWLPAGVAGARAPFIWGPVGGSTHVIPRDLRPPLELRPATYEWSRRALQSVLRRFDPLLGQTRRRASLILTYTSEALDGIPKRHRDKARPIVHIGVDDELPRRSGRPAGSPFTVLSGGRLVHWKGFDLLVEGFAESLRNGGSDAVLVFTGDGSFRESLEQLVRRRGIEERVRFVGRVPARADVYRRLLEADLYALPTLRDGPPTALLEAMHAGTPVLCLDLGATHELVPDGAGLKIAATSRAQIVADIAKALRWAETHPAELADMGEKAQAHASSVHHWDRIGDEVDSIYQSLARS